MQRRPAVPIRRVHHRARRDQDSCDLSVPVARGLVQRRLVEALLRADVRARGEEGRYNFQMAIAGGEVQGRASVRVEGVDDRVGPGGGDGGADDLGAAEAGRVVQDGAVVFVDVAEDGGEGGDEVESWGWRVGGRGGDYFYQLDVCFFIVSMEETEGREVVYLLSWESGNPWLRLRKRASHRFT